MKYLSLFFFSIFSLTSLLAQEAPVVPSARPSLNSLRQGDYEKAILGLSGDLTALAAATDGVDEDELRLHQARAHHLAGKNKEAVALCEDFLKASPASQWRHKVVFLKAQALAGQRKFEEALVIYQEEAARIFSEERQDEIAGQLITFAELFATVPGPEELDAPPADYGKALILFGQVLDTNCSSAVREKVRRRIVTLNGLSQQWAAAESAALAYLGEFDPSWRGIFGSLTRFVPDEGAKLRPAGVGRFQVRYHHAEALHRLNRRSTAVRYLVELDDLAQDRADLKALRADAHWLRLMAMTQRGGVNEGGVGAWVAEARRYLAAYPRHLWASQVASKIASIYAAAERWEEARVAYQEFLDGKGYEAPLEKPLTLDEVSAGDFEKRKRRHEARREAASFEIGAIFLAEKEFVEAEAQWNKTAKNFPNGEKWAECQRGLVQVDFEQALESVRKIHLAEDADKAALREEARVLVMGFLAAHPLDERLPQLMFVLGELSYYEAVARAEGEAFQLNPERKKALEKAVTDWRRLISKYPQSQQAKAAELKIGRVYEHYLGDLEKAVEIYSGLKEGLSYKAALVAKGLKASSPRVFGTQENPEITLALRNVETVKIRQYWIDFESFFRKSQNLSEIEQLDVDLVEPDKTWEIKVPNYQRYLPIQHQVTIPFEAGKAGVCVIKVESGDLESTTVTVRSDLDLAVRSSRKEAVIFARDWMTGKAAPGVKLVLADGAKVIADGVTGADGVWHYQGELLEEVSKLRVLGISDRGMAGHSLQISGLTLPTPLAPVGTMMTSRRLHRPGEMVNLKVIVRDVKGVDCVVPAAGDRDFSLKVRNEEGRLLHQKKVVLNEFGTSQVRFKIPADLRGRQIQLSLEGEIGGVKKSFYDVMSISQARLPWVTLALDFEKEHVAPGEVIQGTVSASYRWGSSLVNRKVTLTLPGGLTRDLQTDENGEAKFAYPTQAGAFKNVEFTAAIPSSDSLTVKRTVLIVKTDVKISAQVRQDVVIADREFTLDLAARSLDDEPLARPLRVVLKRPGEELPDPVLAKVPGLKISNERRELSEKVTEMNVVTDPQTGKASASFTLSEGGTYWFHVWDGDQEVAWEKVTVSDEKDEAKLHLFSLEKDLSEGMTARYELHSRMGESVPTLITIESDRILEHRVIEVQPGSNQFSVPLLAAHAPGFQVHVMALDDRRLHTANLSSQVKRDLKVELVVEGLEGELAQPGQKVKVKLSVKDAAGNPVMAETALAVVRKDDQPVNLSGRVTPFLNSYWGGVFHSGSSCGFQHRGRQAHANLAIREEQNRQSRYQQAILPNSSLPQHSVDNLITAGNRSGFARVSAPRLMEFAASLRGEISEDYRSRPVRTDANGHAELEMTLPDDPDQWVMIGEALTENGRLSGVEKSLMIREALTVRLALPEGVSEGDSFGPSVVISRSDATAEESGVLRLQIGKEEALEKVILFQKGQATQEVFFPVIQVGTEEISFTAEAKLAGLTQTQKGNLQPSRWGASVMDRAGVLAKVGKSEFQLTLPAEAEPTSLKLLLQPSLNEALLGLANSGLEPVSHWRGPRLGNHAAGQLLAQVTLAQYGQKRGLPQERLTEIQNRIENLAATLVVRQGAEGGWASQVGRKKPDLALSAIAYEALVAADRLGHAIDQDVLKRAVDFLNSQISKVKSDDRALIQHALASGGGGDFSACNRLFRARAELSPSGKAHLAIAFIHLKRPEFAKGILENLGKVAPGDLATLGRALQGWASLDANSRQARALEDQIWKQCGFTGFQGDLQRGVGVLGLASIYEVREVIADDYRAVVTVNGKTVAEVKSGEEAGFGSVTVELGILKKGVNEIAITMEGRGSLRAGATVTGVTKEFPKEDWAGNLKINSRAFQNPGLNYRGLPLETRGSSPVTKVTVGDRVRVKVSMLNTRKEGGEVVIWEKIPTGFDYLAGSLSGAHSGASIEDGNLVITHVGKTQGSKSFSYEMVAKTPGEWRIAPTVIRPLDAPTRASYGSEGKLTILPRGEKSDDVYRHTTAERFRLASHAFRDGDPEEASRQLAYVRKDAPNYHAADVARMTLWIETAKAQPEARLVADSFEILNELSPELEIPFEKILRIGNAYRDLKEFERGRDVFLATLEAGFSSESFVGVALEDQGRFLDALDVQTAHWMDFPDEGEISNSWFALAQQLYTKAKDAKDLTPTKGQKKAPDARSLYLKSVAMLARFRITNPDHLLADDAAFTTANALFTLKSFDAMVAHTQASRAAYPKSDFSEAFQYLGALGNFWLRNYEAAFTAAQKVAEGQGKDRNLAAYICAQILHAQGKTVEALKWYGKVKTEYPDARDSIAWFEQKKIALDEVKVIRSGEKVEIVLKHRNIKKADLQIYRVDLMKLYLREKNLSNIEEVNLAGIAPKHEMNVALAQGEFSDQETKVVLPFKEDGAYLIICRGDYLYSSGLVLVTPLKMEVQEDAQAGSVRVNMTDRTTAEYLGNVHMKAIGSGNKDFVTGETDLRGVWKAEALKGTATVIARDEKGRYAFYRGETQLAAFPKKQIFGNQAPVIQKGYYNSNNFDTQQKISDGNVKDFNQRRRLKSKGVKVNKAIKK